MTHTFKKTWLKRIKESPLSGRIAMIVLVLALLIGAMVLSGPKPDDETFNPFATATPLPLTMEPSAVVPTAPTQMEFDQTSGVILAAMVVVAIVLIGAIIFMRQKENPPQ